MEIESHRLLLREWTDSDASELFQLARDPEIGPACGWPAHRNEKESKEVIRNVLRKPDCFAVIRKSDNQLIGSISLTTAQDSNLNLEEGEAELGFWMGRSYWRQHYMYEACQQILAYAFQNIGYRAVWAGYYEGNDPSRKLQEKLGMTYVYSWFVVNRRLRDAYQQNVMRLTRKEFTEKRA